MKRTLIGLGLLALASTTLADTLPAARYAEMMKMEQMDTDRDGMVTREEFLAAAARMFDMAAEHMKVRDGRMAAHHVAELRRRITAAN